MTKFNIERLINNTSQLLTVWSDEVPQLTVTTSRLTFSNCSNLVPAPCMPDRFNISIPRCYPATVSSLIPSIAPSTTMCTNSPALRLTTGRNTVATVCHYVPGPVPATRVNITQRPGSFSSTTYQMTFSEWFRWFECASLNSVDEYRPFEHLHSSTCQRVFLYCLTSRYCSS